MTESNPGWEKEKERLKREKADIIWGHMSPLYKEVIFLHGKRGLIEVLEMLCRLGEMTNPVEYKALLHSEEFLSFSKKYDDALQAIRFKR